MKKVLITVPHGFCSPGVNRNCDRVASERAEMIERELIKNNIKVTVIKANVPREFIDQNRIPSRYHTSFRREISHLLNSGNYNVVLDVHSFPVDSGSWPNNDVVVLQDKLNDEYSIKLAQMLGTTLVPGISNDIIDQANEIKYVEATALLEFIESESSNKISLAKIIVAWVKMIQNE